MPLRTTWLALALVVAVPVAAVGGGQSSARPSSPAQQSTAQQSSPPQSSSAKPSASQEPVPTWYQTYEEAIGAVQRRDWKQAEALLLEARRRHPEQGRQVLVANGNSRPFVPDYYLAQVYLNTSRAAEALTTLAGVRKANLVDEKDASFRDVMGRAMDAVVAQARAAAYDDRGADVVRMVAALRAADADPQLVGEFQGYIDREANAAPPPNVANVEQRAPDGKADDVSGAPDLLNAGADPPTSGNAAKGTAGSNRRSAQDAKTAAGGKPALASQQPDVAQTLPRANRAQQAASRQPAWDDGLRAFLAGDYVAATELLGPARDPSAPPRMRLYLACAEVGRVLVGLGDAALLTDAREQFRTGNLAAAMRPEDQRYISPRILAQLGAQ